MAMANDKKTINALDSLLETLGPNLSQALLSADEITKTQEYRDFADTMEQEQLNEMTPKQITDKAKEILNK